MAKDRARDPRRVFKNEGALPKSHVAVGQDSLKPGFYTSRAGNVGGAFEGQIIGSATVPTGKDNEPHYVHGGHSINTSTRVSKDDPEASRKAKNAASDNLVNNLSNGVFVKNNQNDSEMTDKQRKMNKKVGSGDRAIVKIRSDK